jgi:hypothetical protein
MASPGITSALGIFLTDAKIPFVQRFYGARPEEKLGEKLGFRRVNGAKKAETLGRFLVERKLSPPILGFRKFHLLFLVEQIVAEN